MPFGYLNAPQVFQRRMDNIFRPYSEFSLIYIDDILVASKTEIEHVYHLKKIILELEKHGIVISKRKMQLFQT